MDSQVDTRPPTDILPGYIAYGDVTSHRDTRTVAHRPRKGRLSRGAGLDRPAACQAGDDAPEQTGYRPYDNSSRDGLAGGLYRPIETGWSEMSASRAKTLGYEFCQHDECFGKMEDL